MKLLGSSASPYVRRIRLLLDQDYEFVELKVFTPEGASELEKYTPIKRVPVLVDNEKVIFDSTIIAEYLLDKKGIHLSIDEKLFVKLVNELCDTGIILFQQKFLESDPEWKNNYSERQVSRLESLLSYIDTTLINNDLTHYEQDWLFCALDWFTFRDVYHWQKFNNLNEFFHKFQNEERYINTSPRT